MYHDGKCQNLHGHSYTIAVELRSATLTPHGPKQNMVADFSDVSAVVRKLIKSHLDHHHLNKTLGTDSPTAEFIAHWCFHRLQPDIPFLSAVEIRETATSSIVYRPQVTQAPLMNGYVMPHAHGVANGVSNGVANGVANGARTSALRLPHQAGCERCSSCPHCEKRTWNGTPSKAFANGYSKEKLLPAQAPIREDHKEDKVANVNGT